MTNEVLNTDASPAPRRGRKRADATNEVRVVSRLHSIEERHYYTALEAPDVKVAIHDYEGAQARRDSISRKLCGGSTAVTVDDLGRWEASLATAKKTLAQLALRTPILKRHPAFASVIDHS
ncbi:hypothetical protein R6242_16265 [Iodobacter sp. CM08]|uniref:hypothetical protein n=1 Tax=Iodobacter sp. CM08 TaxID=3085902 RepID=UPI002980AB7F|nr:hypothetical protein [Iodobacter sp. CM08]MDW5418122.1 hypothetical protein [Iodobacter sp. CM08]